LIEDRYDARTIGVLPHTFLTGLADIFRDQPENAVALLFFAKDDKNPEASFFDGVRAEIVFARSPEVLHAKPARDAARAWEKEHPDRILVGMYTKPLVENLLDIVREIL
jgi:hypothetical protein